MAKQRVESRDLVMLAKPEKEVPGLLDLNPEDYFASEKYDGVRALFINQLIGQPVENIPWLNPTKMDRFNEQQYWSGMCSRYGNNFCPPQDWLDREGLTSDCPILDGEIFGGRNKFNWTVGVAKSLNSPDWDSLHFLAFDAPYAECLRTGNISVNNNQKYQIPFHNTEFNAAPFGMPFERRLALIPANVKQVEQRVFKDWKDVFAWKDELVAQGAEGVILKKRNCIYRQKRSDDIVKLKINQEHEYRVIGIEPPKALSWIAEQGLPTGALVCEHEGKRFTVGSGLDKEQRALGEQYWVGKIVTVSFMELTPYNVPRSGVLKCIRDYE